MGLQTVEFVMAIEEEFSIKIPDQDAGQLATVRNLVDYIEKKAAEMGRLKIAHCPTQTAFYSFRAKALPMLKISRKQFRPKACLSALVPGAQPREFSGSIAEHFGFQLLSCSLFPVSWTKAPKWRFKTVADVVNKLVRGVKFVVNRAELEDRVWKILEEQVGIRRKDFHLDSRFVQDMNMD